MLGHSPSSSPAPEPSPLLPLNLPSASLLPLSSFYSSPLPLPLSSLSSSRLGPTPTWGTPSTPASLKKACRPAMPPRANWRRRRRARRRATQVGIWRAWGIEDPWISLSGSWGATLPQHTHTHMSLSHSIIRVEQRALLRSRRPARLPGATASSSPRTLAASSRRSISMGRRWRATTSQ